jgi:dethiobiotin synthetase
MQGCFVSGTDTGAGKTVLAAAIAAALSDRGVRVRPLKPFLTGLDDPPDAAWPHDHEVLAIASGVDAREIALRTYGPAVSPHLAAELTGIPIDVEGVLAELGGGDESPGATFAVVEGVGGLLVPLADGWDVRRFAAALDLPVILAARPGLGTINHSLLTIEAARGAGLEVAGVVFTPWPAEPTAMERSNMDTVARLGGVEVAGLELVERADRTALARAGAALPLERWLRVTFR